MRRIILFCFILLLASCKSKSPENSMAKATSKVSEKNIALIKPEEVDAVKKDRAYNIGTRLLGSCNSSRFRTFTSAEATDKVRQNATREKVAAICQKINQRSGRFRDIELIDITRNKKLKEYTFRYSIDYEKKLYKKELFVTVNEGNQVSAIITKEVKPKTLASN
ncbi:MAG TPA: hypothetical protein PKN96_10195 [Flavobacterium sp.]|uniref:hypothetical protein n=1 Tax=Flavobacterium sp. TaxID=239 RepID=UPI002CF2189F|nr:hypothetical protein [Flavobacterium sp.]HNP33652.1 hypothetical protein [Flavobacterium sp.]